MMMMEHRAAPNTHFLVHYTLMGIFMIIEHHPLVITTCCYFEQQIDREKERKNQRNEKEKRREKKEKKEKGREKEKKEEM